MKKWEKHAMKEYRKNYIQRDSCVFHVSHSLDEHKIK